SRITIKIKTGSGFLLDSGLSKRASAAHESPLQRERTRLLKQDVAFSGLAGSRDGVIVTKISWPFRPSACLPMCSRCVPLSKWSVSRVLFCAFAWVLAVQWPVWAQRPESQRAARSQPERKLLYVATPGIRNYLEYGGHGVVVFDIERNHNFVKRIPS